jgi:hypothetical protein
MLQEWLGIAVALAGGAVLSYETTGGRGAPRGTAMKPVRVGIIGAGNVLWAYLQVLDRLTPRGLASAGPVCARRRENWTRLRERRPGIELVDEAAAVLRSDVDVVVIITSPESHAALKASTRA